MKPESLGFVLCNNFLFLLKGNLISVDGVLDGMDLEMVEEISHKEGLSPKSHENEDQQEE